MDYRVQRAVVAVMFDVIGRLLVGASESDETLREELRGFPEGHVIGFAVLGDSLTMRVKVHAGRFVRTQEKPALEIVFKHVAHAYLIVTFQESTARAFANDRALTHGDIGLGMRFVRCLNRMEALSLPGFVASRALKAPLPAMPAGERVRAAAQLYGRVGRNLIGGKS
jgi:hypothetical protein